MTPITLGMGLICKSEPRSRYEFDAFMTLCLYCLMKPLKHIDSAWSKFSSALSADPILASPIEGARVNDPQSKETPPEAQSPLGCQ
eukprot:scaffold82707_cov19-Prasinocladus_malaysianus.AAC.1